MQLLVGILPKLSSFAMKKNKVFCFIQLYHISQAGGGAEVQTNFLAKELVKRGHEVHYICQRIYNEKVSLKSNINGIKMHWIPLQSNSIFKKNKLIYKNLCLIQPDYIIERMSSVFALAIIRYKKISNSKYIWICTDNIAPLKYKNIYSSYKNLNFMKFIIMFFKNLAIDFIRQKAVKVSDLSFYQNDIQKRIIIKNFKKKPLKIISGHPSLSTRCNIKKNFENQTVLWCGNLGMHKRPELFVKLSKEFEKSKIKFIMVGGHYDINYLNSLFKNKPQNLIVIGKVSFEESLNYFDKSTILVNTSFSEGFSNTYIQAWLRGIPTLVMGADPDGLIEINQLGYNCKSINSIVHKVNSLLNDKNSYTKMSEYVKCYAEKNHSIKVMSDHFLRSINL